MKKIIPLILLTTIFNCAYTQIINPLKAAKNAITNQVNTNINSAVNNGVNNADKNLKKTFNKRNQASKDSVNSVPEKQEMTKPKDDFKAYNNFDFVAGENILFEDNFATEAIGEFPAHWKLKDGQAVVNKAGDENAFFITKYYTDLSPRMKKPNYLPEEFTVEFDAYLDKAYDSNDGIYLGFVSDNTILSKIKTNREYTYCEYPDGKLIGEYPKEIKGENYLNKWHHYSIAYSHKQIKVYCDQYRTLTVPDCNFKANSIMIGGDASDGSNMMFKNFKLAAGGGMYMIGKKFTDTKIITHGINFDYNKTNIKTESMGTLNMILQIMKDNPDLKFEIGGYTDADGDEVYNKNLSQLRAEAVKNRLVALGVAADRLSCAGYGETKPISNNLSLEGKANNRRVEFVKK